MRSLRPNHIDKQSKIEGQSEEYNSQREHNSHEAAPECPIEISYYEFVWVYSKDCAAMAFFRRGIFVYSKFCNPESTRSIRKWAFVIIWLQGKKELDTTNSARFFQKSA
jgi:hypothetical protein